MDMPGLAAMPDAVIEGNHCAIYPFRNESGEGTITIYQVFPGVCLAYNDFHMRYYDSAFRPGQDLLCIDHCREGRLEYPVKGGRLLLCRGRGPKAGPTADPYGPF